VRALYDRMARVDVTPTWVTIQDFETPLARAVADVIAEKSGGGG
jgi:hypothetical protein